MDRKLIVLFILLPFLFIVFVTLSRKPVPPNNVLPAQTEADTPSTPFLEVLGYNVYIQNSGSSEWVVAKDQQEILPGATVKTDKGGLAQIIYPNGTVTRLDTDTQITLKEYNPTPQTVTVFVTAGKIWSRITKLLGGESYKSESKNLVATVRGTIYEHAVLPDGEDKISVTSHVVHVSCSKNKVEADVTENETAQTGCALKPKLVQTPETEKQTKWVTFNKQEDEKLMKRFKKARYEENDEKGGKDKSTPTPTPSPSATPIPTPTLTILPTSTPTITPTPSTSPIIQGGASPSQ